MEASTPIIVIGPLATIHLGSIEIPTYNVVISLVISAMVFYTYLRSDQRDVSFTTAIDLFLICIVSGSIGARLVHVFYEAPNYYQQNPLHIFYIWQGGFVFYGGLLSGLFAGWLSVKIIKQPLAPWLDFFTPVLSLGYALGRLACLLAGCCYGRVCDWPWALSSQQMSLIDGTVSYARRHPTQIYATLLELGIFFIILKWERRKMALAPGLLFLMWLSYHSLSRIIMEFFRDDDRGFFILGMSLSTLISLMMMVTSIFYIIKIKNKGTS